MIYCCWWQNNNHGDNESDNDDYNGERNAEMMVCNDSAFWWNLGKPDESALEDKIRRREEPTNISYIIEFDNLGINKA